MDEVKAMSRAGETVGKAVGTGVHEARKGATQAGKVGREVSKQAVARAEQELANHGVDTDDLQERLAQRTTGMSRKQLAKQTAKARKDWEKTAAKSRKEWNKKAAKGRKKRAKSRQQLAGNADAARKEFTSRLDSAPAKRRKWPWVLLVLAALAAVAAVALSRRPEEYPLPADAEEDRFPSHDADSGRNPGSTNGAGPTHNDAGTSRLGSDREA